MSIRSKYGQILAGILLYLLIPLTSCDATSKRTSVSLSANSDDKPLNISYFSHPRIIAAPSKDPGTEVSSAAAQKDFDVRFQEKVASELSLPSRPPLRREQSDRQRRARGRTQFTRNLQKNTDSDDARKQEKKLAEVLKELSTQSEAVTDEACGTRWSKSVSNTWNAKFQPLKTYGTLFDSPLPSENRNRRHVSDVSNDARSSAIYFPGHSTLRWSPTSKRPQESTSTLSFRTDSFTAELWIRPEGGQQNPAVIIEAGEKNNRKELEEVTSVWTLGIKSQEDGSDRNAVLYFSITKENGGTITILGGRNYKPEQWTHLAVTSDGTTIRLFVDAVQVAVTHKGRNQENHYGAKTCNILTLGGNKNATNGYRGAIHKLRVWNRARHQSELRNSMYNFDTTADYLTLKENFEHFHESWASKGETAPRKVFESTPTEDSRLHFPEFRAPTCGQTVCDNPDIVRSYVKNWTLRKLKHLRYSLVSVSESDGTNPMLTHESVIRQNFLLNQIFEKHNITWIPTLVNINDSNLRRKTIGCEPTKIGNNECNRECMHARLGRDGGDCDVDESPCHPESKGNGHCDHECNKIYHEWDLGDCCNQSLTDTDQTCFDPASRHRAYISITEYKQLIGADNTRQLSVLFANWTNPNSIGISTFPWDKNVFAVEGGTVVQLKPYTSRDEMSGLVHELGHNLGLLHVHHGSHGIRCDDACAELRASMTTGDLCEDTNPTPMNTNCGEPNEQESVCNLDNFTGTPYNNFMGYADGSCQDNFTPQQRARMHCYIDLVYDAWTEAKRLAPIPLPPKVVASSHVKRTVTLTWAPPIDGRLVGGRRQCDPRCNANGSLSQFAANASSLDASAGSAWSADQATGPPDQEPCSLRGMHFWMPSGTHGTGAECGSMCYIDLDFSDAVIPALLRLWVTYGTEGDEGIKSIELKHADGTATTISSLHAYCDMPISVRINTDKKTKHIRIHVHRPYTAIDAVEIISEENNPLCSGCRGIKYKIIRDPPFPDGFKHTTEHLTFTDTSCEDGIEYQYSVQPTLHSTFGEISPPSRFQLGQTFCGDGKVQDENSEGLPEKCDDGNTDDGDGCNVSCGIESSYHCKGEPSLCYRYEGDGICEDFERSSSVDCLLTPYGYQDQWAADATSSSAAVEALNLTNVKCSGTNESLGPPDSVCVTLGSARTTIENRAWSPCTFPGVQKTAGDHWIKMFYDEPVLPTSVLIYSASEDSTLKDMTLILPDEIISARNVRTVCEANPLTIDIPEKKNRSKIREIIIRFSSTSVAIDAVALRSKSNECVANESFKQANVTCVEEGTALSSLPVGMTLRDGAICSVNCNPGYLPKTSQKLVCKSGKWDGTVKCIPVSCNAPTHVKFASFTCEKGHVLDATCNFTCLKPARMVGTDNTFRCDGNGTWTPPLAYCEPPCGMPPKIGFAFPSCDALTRRATRPGDTCKYRCKTGYHVIQQSFNKKTFRLTCGADGVWKGTGCQPVVCPSLQTAYAGLHKCSRGHLFGSVCSISCQAGLTEISEVVRCESNGKWNATLPSCSKRHGECDAPSAPPGVEITCTGYGAGQTCQARCIRQEAKGSYDIITSTAMEVRPKGKQPNRRTTVLVCTGNSWCPEPNELRCYAECDSRLLGNKRCDPTNNRAYCGWDEGDCCKSTTSMKRVIKVPPDCGDDCACKDPDAVENTPAPDRTQPVSEAEKRFRVILLPLNARKSKKLAVCEANKQLIAVSASNNGRAGTTSKKTSNRNRKKRRKDDGRKRNRKPRRRGRHKAAGGKMKSRKPNKKKTKGQNDAGCTGEMSTICGFDRY